MKSFKLSDKQKQGSGDVEGTIVAMLLFGIVFFISLTAILWTINASII